MRNRERIERLLELIDCIEEPGLAEEMRELAYDILENLEEGETEEE
jgi:hypothetical protein